MSRRSVRAFLVLVCLLSWPVWLASGVLSRAGTGGYDARWLVAQLGVMGPLLAARASPVRVSQMPLLPAVATVVVTALVVLFLAPLKVRLLGPGTGTPQARPPARVVLLSLTLFPALFLLSWTLVSAKDGHFEIAALQGGPLASVWILLVCFAHNLLLGGSLGEEFGWRGFLLPALLRERSPFQASLVLAVVGGLWHLPIDLYAGFGVNGPGAILVRILFLVPVSIFFTWFYLRSNGSVLIAILLHTSINVMSDLGPARYETAALVFGLLTGVAAVIVASVSPVFRGVGAGT